MAQLHNIVRNGTVTSQQIGSAESANASMLASGITTGLETFTLEYKVIHNPWVLGKTEAIDNMHVLDDNVRFGVKYLGFRSGQHLWGFIVGI